MDRRHGTQRLHRHRIEVRQRGFTLIELMVVVALVALLGGIAMTSFRAQRYKGQYEAFVSDLHGALVQARNTAIDQQREVMVTIDVGGVTVTGVTPAGLADANDILDDRRIAGGRNNELLDGRACVMGLETGVRAPSQAAVLPPPTTCLGAGARPQIVYAPDGTFVETPSVATANSGLTLWVADQRTTDPRRSMIQLFPGGYIRSFVEVES